MQALAALMQFAANEYAGEYVGEYASARAMASLFNGRPDAWPPVGQNGSHPRRGGPMAANDADLLDAARLGDQGAWDALVADYNNLVWSIARGFRLETADAHDAVQMTWLRLVENLDRINDPQRLAGWLATTARRECLQLLRKSGRERPASDDVLRDLPDPAAPVDAALLLDERDGALWRAFKLIGERCQQLLRILMASPPPSYREVSAALDVAVGTIGPARQRCLDDLRRRIAADDSLTGQLHGEPT
jgi:RNA polymerase sigma factor (sigma-70 family)